MYIYYFKFNLLKDGNGIGVWEHFLRDRTGTSGKCVVVGENGEPCHEVKSMGKKKSPPSLISHLARIHNITLKRGSDGDVPCPKRAKKDPLQSMVSHLTAEDGLPFRVIVQSITLRKLFSAYGHDIPTSPTLHSRYGFKGSKDRARWL